MDAYASFPVLTFPVSTLSCWAQLICTVFVGMWDVTFAGVSRYHPEIKAGGTAIDLLYGLLDVQKRFGEKVKKGEWPDVFIAAQWSRSACPGFNQFLGGCLTLTSTRFTTLRTSLIVFFFSLWILLQFCSIVAESSHYFCWFSQIVWPTLWTIWLTFADIFSLFDLWKL